MSRPDLTFSHDQERFAHNLVKFEFCHFLLAPRFTLHKCDSLCMPKLERHGDDDVVSIHKTNFEEIDQQQQTYEEMFSFPSAIIIFVTLLLQKQSTALEKHTPTYVIEQDEQGDYWAVSETERNPCRTIPPSNSAIVCYKPNGAVVSHDEIIYVQDDNIEAYAEVAGTTADSTASVSMTITDNTTPNNDVMLNGDHINQWQGSIAASQMSIKKRTSSISPCPIGLIVMVIIGVCLVLVLACLCCCVWKRGPTKPRNSTPPAAKAIDEDDTTDASDDAHSTAPADDDNSNQV